VASIARYVRWDGTQDPFGPDVDVGGLLDELADDVLMGERLDEAVRRLLRRGIRGRARGLDELRRRLRERLGSSDGLNLEGPLERIRERLDGILERERAALALDPSQDARARELFLGALRPDVAGRIRELRDYGFTDPGARRAFEELMAELAREVLGSAVGRIAEGLRAMGPEALARLKDVLAELNDLLERRARGEDPREAFERFMERHGDLFPDRPSTLDQLLEGLARRAVAMSRLLASLDEERRAELRALAESVLQDLDLAFEVARLTANLASNFPELPWGTAVPAAGERALPLEATLSAIEERAELEELDRALEGAHPGATLADVDEEALRRALGEVAVTDLRRLREVERALERIGFAERRAGRLELTPRGARMLGERALARVFERLRGRSEGAHDARDPGGSGEATGATRPWAFGDEGRIAAQRTVFNAVMRGGPTGGPVRIAAEDLELVEVERRVETATALLLDLSFSMPLRGHLVHAKRMALALHTLIESRYPHDTLHLIGFSDYARRLRLEDLAAPGIERTYGTNMQHAFLLAGRLLAEHPRAERQVIMVTDGEPTAHLEDGEAYFAWPPEPETIRRTLVEAVRLARSGVVLNVFMLEDSEGLTRFMDRLARLTRGRVFLLDDDRVGDFVLRDYVARRSR
jgi:uncharacterized protein with von Willebrand factor type A (vWA) domain